MLNNFCDTEQHLDVQVEGVERVEYGTCDNPHCRRAAAVSVMRAGSIIPEWESRSRRGHEQQRQRRGPPSRKAHTSVVFGFKDFGAAIQTIAVI